jgi:hypothetical protein
MATNESQINHIYGSEDAQGILQLAIDFYGYKVRIHVWAIAPSENASGSITVHQ